MSLQSFRASASWRGKAEQALVLVLREEGDRLVLLPLRGERNPRHLLGLGDHSNLLWCLRGEPALSGS